MQKSKNLGLNYEDTCIYASDESKTNDWCLVQDASWDNYEEIPRLNYVWLFNTFQRD